jgi:hypothetical protein
MGYALRARDTISIHCMCCRLGPEFMPRQHNINQYAFCICICRFASFEDRACAKLACCLRRLCVQLRLPLMQRSHALEEVSCACMACLVDGMTCCMRVCTRLQPASCCRHAPVTSDQAPWYGMTEHVRRYMLFEHAVRS